MPSRTTTAATFAAGLAGGMALGRALSSPQARFARMAGSSIAAPDAAGWITDFLNAAYFRRPDGDGRGVDDLRLAFAIVTTRWHRGGHHRLRMADGVAFHRAFGRDRFLDGARSPRGTLHREQLLEGATRLLGPWFAEAYADDARRGWGIVFADAEERAAYRPEVRLEAARLGPLTPPEAPPTEQTWHTYPPVAMPSAQAVIAALSATERWGDYASEVGRFTALRSGGLPRQTFEIEVAAGTAAGRPLFTRGYVTITRVVSALDDEAALQGYVDELNDGLRRFGRDEPPAVPDGATPVLAFDLTTHEGHFMGRGRNRLVLFDKDGRALVRAAGTWDPMPWHIEQAYRRAGRDAQHAFWGQGEIASQRCSTSSRCGSAPARRPPPDVRGRAVVIGAGPNGLAAAITLAEAGREVVVLEASDRPGGAVRTEELTLPGFRHDVFSAVYPAAAASPVFARMGLERHGLRWVHPPACYAHPLPGGRAGALYRDVRRTAAALDELRPGDGAAWAGFAAAWLARFGALRDTMLSGFPPVRGPARLLARGGLRAGLDFARLLLMPADALGHELFADGGARAWLYGAAMHGDVPPHGAGSAIAATYLNVLGHAVGWPSPEGGAERLAQALVSKLRSAGGEVRCGARVRRVAVERGRVTGVAADGAGDVAASLVIADTTPHGLLALAGEALDGRYAAALRRYRYGPGTMKVDWALDGPIPWEAPAAREAGTVHVGGDEGDVLEATSAHAALPERPFLLLGQQSLADPSRAPAGRHTAWAYTHGPKGVDWRAEAERHVERIEAQVERFAPGFRDRILARHVMLPADLEGRDPNLVGGDVGAGSYTLDQTVFRPLPSLTPYRTPVRGLYLGSASTFPGGAVHGVPGHAAARLAVAEARLRTF